MLNKIDALLAETEKFVAKTKEELDEFRIKMISKKGEIPSLFTEFKNVPNEMKKEFGEDFDFSQIGEILDELPVGEDLINVVDSEEGENVRIFLR